MGNHISSFPASDATCKIVYCDGSVQEFDQPITVAELMLDHPQQVVVDFHSALKSQKRPTPLPADKKLEMKKTYVMLPVKRGKPVALSGDDSRRVLSIVNNSSLHSNYLMCSGFLPWIVKGFKTESPAIGVTETLHIKEESYDFSEFLPEGRPEYMSRQLSGKEWKPNLDTIKEKKVKRKLSHWLFLKRFIDLRI